MILISSVAAIVVSYIYLFLIRYFGGIMIWIAFTSSFLLLIGGGLYSFFYARPRQDPNAAVYNYLAYLSYVLWALAGLILFSMLCCFNAI